MIIEQTLGFLETPTLTPQNPYPLTGGKGFKGKGKGRAEIPQGYPWQSLHVRSRLSVQSTHALLCVGVWSLLGYVKDDNVKAAAVLPVVDGMEEELAEGWDYIDALE